MQFFKRFWLGTAASAVILAAWGCDGGGGGTPAVSGSKTEASVSGVVTKKGKPVTGGSVAFDPSNINRRDAAVRTAEIGKDGKYTIKTLVGPNSIRTTAIGVSMAPPKNVDVTEGENTIDIEVGH